MTETNESQFPTRQRFKPYAVTLNTAGGYWSASNHPAMYTITPLQSHKLRALLMVEFYFYTSEIVKNLSREGVEKLLNLLKYGF